MEAVETVLVIVDVEVVVVFVKSFPCLAAILACKLNAEKNKIMR